MTDKVKGQYSVSGVTDDKTRTDGTPRKKGTFKFVKCHLIPIETQV